MNGFAGKLLRVNLTTRSVKEEVLDPATAYEDEHAVIFVAAE